MGDYRYITIKAAYEDLHHAPSLRWIAPELKDAGLTMTEDHTDVLRPLRTWAGIVDGPTFNRFADSWHLNDAPRGRTFDGMNWEVGEQSPIIYVSVDVGVVRNGYDAEAHGPPPVLAGS
jgi:hypothetical protein